MKTEVIAQAGVFHTRVQLTGRDILRLVAAARKVKVTRESQVLITVPRGGDYAGMTLDLTEKDAPVITVTSKEYDLVHTRGKKRAAR